MPITLLEFITQHKQWSRQTFGEGEKTNAIIAHIRQEIEEVERDPKDPEEWIDLAILAIDGAWRCGPHTAAIVEQTLLNKFEKNRKRKWVITDDPNAPIEHDRSEE